MIPKRQLSDREFLDTRFPPRSPGVVLVRYHRDEIARLLKLANKPCNYFGENDKWDYYNPDRIADLVTIARQRRLVLGVETLTMQGVLDPAPSGKGCLRFTSDDLCQYEPWGYFTQEKITKALHMQPGDTVSVTFTKRNG